MIRTEVHVQYFEDELFCHDLCGFRRDLHPEIPTAWPVVVRPDWVCELLSPTHEKRDRIDKWNVLFRAKVPHYWIVNPEERLLEVHRWTPSGYEFALKATSGDLVRAEPFDAVELRAAVLFGDEDDDE
jgi:Uma2 family endonuclease